MPDGGPIPPPDPLTVARFRLALDRRRTQFGLLPQSGRIGVAVSGGADSLALLLLAHAAFPAMVEAATVDHGLRAESAIEALMVAEVCGRLGVPHAVRVGSWDSAAAEGLQAAARTYRYRELGDWCIERRLDLLLTAHHADDQAETILMRLARGAGVGGLSGIRPSRPLPAAAGAGTVHLVRPLLGFTKAELVRLVDAAGLTAVDDPSNDGERFDRTHARRLLATAGWLDPARLAASADHLADADAALTWAADREARARITGDVDGRIRILDPTDLPDELLRRIVVRMVRTVENRAGEDGPEARGPEVTRLIARLRAGHSATLGRVLARPGPRWRFTAAPPRRS